MSNLPRDPRAGAPVDIVNSGETILDVAKPLLKMLAAGEISVPTLGPLTNLPGAWAGKGFNLVELPNNFAKNPNEKFRLLLNATLEFTEFTAISSPIPNRGNTQDDIFFLGLTYQQRVFNAETSELLHIEPGIFLNLPSNPVQMVPTVVRLSTIPHGDSLLAQGLSVTVPMAPQFAVADPTPFTIEDGKRVNDDSTKYLAPFDNTPPPAGIIKDAIKNPNILLQNFNDDLAAAGKKILSTTVFQVNATPVGGIANVPPFNVFPDNKEGGIVNIPFVVKNANAVSMSATFYINTVQNQDGTQFLVLQYSQTVLLEFPVPDPSGKMQDLFWPHISVASLLKS
jgi:hypothetical protein